MKLVVLWVPVAVLANGGYRYVRGALSLLRAPGVPVELTYVGRGGKPVRLAADWYSIDLGHGTAVLRRPRLYDPAGGIVATLDLVEATGLKPLQLTDQIVRVRAIGLTGTITRLRSGQFDLTDLLPERKGPPTTIPFEFELDRARVTFVDRLGRTPWQRTISTRQVRVTGLGDDWIATTDAAIEGIGSVPLRIQNVANEGIQASTVVRSAEVAPVVAHLLETPTFDKVPIRGLTMKSLRVSGPVRVFLPESSAVKAEVRLVAEGEGLRYGKYALDRAKFAGFVSTQGLNGVLDAALGPARARFRGSANWQKAVRVAGAAEVSTPNSESLPAWVRPMLPAGLGFDGSRFTGWVAYTRPTDYRVSGEVFAADVRYQGETINGLQARVAVDPKAVAGNLRQASYRGEPLTGAFAIDTRAKTLSGGVAAQRVDLALLAHRFGLKGVSGSATVAASIGGTLERPAIDVDAEGRARYAQNDRQFDGRFQLSGRYNDAAIDVRRALVTGDFGLLSASGSVGTKGAVGIQVVGRNLRPGAFDPRLGGRANLVAQVGGTAQNPVARGYLEGYNLEFQNYVVPVVATDFVADRRRFALDGLRATRGTAELTGNAALRYADGALSAQTKVRSLQIADLFGEEFAGAIDLPEARVSGTLDHPALDARLEGKSLIAKGVKIDALGAHIVSDGRVARVESGTAELAGGKVEASASYNIDHRRGTAEARISRLSLQEIVPKLSTAVAVEGTAGGVIRAAFSPSGVSSLDASGRLRDVAINETQVGGGPVSLTYDGRHFGGSLQIGSLERYVSLDDLTYDPKTEALGGKVALFNNRVEDWIAISSRYLPSLPIEQQDALNTARGVLNLGGTFGGTRSNLSLDVTSLAATELRYRDVPFGTLTSRFSLANHRWNLPDLTVSGGVLDANVSGTVDELGATDLDAELNNVQLADIGRLLPAFAGQTGSASVKLIASGPTKLPDIRGSVKADGLFRGPLDPVEQGLSFTLFGRFTGASNSLYTKGGYSYKGFTGSVEATTPLELPGRIPPNGNVEATVTVAERPLKEISEMLGLVDPARAEGTVSGFVKASGPANDLSLTGEVNLLASRIGFLLPPQEAKGKPIKSEDTLQDVRAQVALNGGQVAVSADAKSSRGGSLSAKLSVPVTELRTLTNTLQTQGLASLMDNPITGQIALNDLAFRQGFPRAATDVFTGLSNGYLGGSAKGVIDIRGSVQRPRINGEVALSNVQSDLPTFGSGTGEESTPSVNPAFDLRLTLANAARLRTSTADLSVLGSAAVTGSLSAPTVRGTLEVDKGTIRLPAALVRLEQGGTVTLNYQPSAGGTFAGVDVDLTGRTSVSAQRYADVYERYDISLGVRGDLLKDGGLTLTAESDPPDLSQEQILQILGRTDVLEAVGSNFGSSSTERRIRDALAGYALPALTDPITARLAQGLGLEYLTVEYNSYEQASLVAAKALGSGFSVQARRQISEPPPGFRPLYDFRLVYRPRRVRGVLSRFSFSIGADQDRPLKIALEYGTRF